MLACSSPMTFQSGTVLAINIRMLLEVFSFGKTVIYGNWLFKSLPKDNILFPTSINSI